MRTLLLISLLCGCDSAVGQSSECAQWVACWEALPGSTKGGLDDAYGPEGACWRGTTRDRNTCTTQCKEAVAENASRPNAPAECK